MNGFEKRANLIKEKIINTTLEMIKTCDPKKIRIADIAKKANVSQVTIYNYFGNKEGLIHGVARYSIDKAVSDFEGYMNGNFSIKEKIEQMILHEKKSYHTLPMSIINQLYYEDQEITDYLEKLYQDKVLPPLIQLLEDGKESGEISSKVSTDSFLAFLNMYMKQSKELLEMAEKSGNMDFIDGISHLFFYGICGKP